MNPSHYLLLPPCTALLNCQVPERVANRCAHLAQQPRPGRMNQGGRLQ